MTIGLAAGATSSITTNVGLENEFDSPGVRATANTVGSQQNRTKASDTFGAYIDKNLGADIQLAFGPSVDIAKVAFFTTAMKKQLRASVGAAMGVFGGVAAGGIGGTAGGGANLQAGGGAGLAAGSTANIGGELTTGLGMGAGFVGGASGNVAGVAAGATSLGSSLGTRASLPGASGAPVNFGTATGGSFGVGAQAGFGAGTGGGISASAMGQVSASVFAAFDAALIASGFSKAEREELKQNVTPELNSAVQGPFESSFGPELGYPNASGVPMLGCKVVMQERGAWTASVTLDEENESSEPPTGPFVIDVDGVEFRGTVVPDRTGAWGGKQKLRVIGGAGGLDTELQPRNYAGGLTRLKTVVDDIMRDSGESLSPECDPAILATRLPAWQRSRSSAKESLDVLCAKLGLTWRVLRDGTIWIGVDQWPEVEPTGDVMQEHHSDGVVRVAPDFATLVPGIVVRGQKIKQVIHVIDENSKESLRSECHARSSQDLISKILEKQNKKNEYSFQYGCKVTRQNADGTVDVLVDDERMKGRGVGKCRIRVGIPGSYVKVPAGARCLVGWEGADPSLPYVDHWESGTPLTSVQVGPNKNGAAHVGSTVKVIFPALVPFNGTIGGTPVAGVLTILESGVGIIETGSSALLV